jgi:methionyl-tRNA synthetase
MKELIEFKDFLEIESKLEIKVGKITNVEDVPKSDKLLKLTVDFGDEQRVVVTNIKPQLKIESALLSGLMFLFVTNLKPTKIMGIESTAMIMPGELDKDLMITINSNPGAKFL